MARALCNGLTTPSMSANGSLITRAGSGHSTMPMAISMKAVGSTISAMEGEPTRILVAPSTQVTGKTTSNTVRASKRGQRGPDMRAATS